MTELGSTLRGWRDRLSAADAGLPVTARRRALGLRREELARLTGISVDYITRLEQGRADRPSAQVLHARAQALRLSPEERDHLFMLVGRRRPGTGCGWNSRRVSPGCSSSYRLRSWSTTRCGPSSPGTARTRCCSAIPQWHGLATNLLWRYLTGTPTRVRGGPGEGDGYVMDGPPYLGFDRSYDVYGDGSVVIVLAGGHTPGSVVVFVTPLAGPRYAFIGDITWQCDGITKRVERPWLLSKMADDDPAVVRVGLSRMIALAEVMRVVPAHDLAAFDGIPTLN